MFSLSKYIYWLLKMVHSAELFSCLHKEKKNRLILTMRRFLPLNPVIYEFHHQMLIPYLCVFITPAEADGRGEN